MWMKFNQWSLGFNSCAHFEQRKRVSYLPSFESNRFKLIMISNRLINYVTTLLGGILNQIISAVFKHWYIVILIAMEYISFSIYKLLFSSENKKRNKDIK